MRQHLWPVAAAVGLGAVVYSGALIKHAQAGSVENKVATIESESGSAKTMQLEMEQLNVRAKYLRQLDNDLTAPPIHELLAQIVTAKPATVYLDDINVGSDGTIILMGKAETDEAMLAFEAKLKSVSLLRSPGIVMSQKASLPTAENAIGFTLKAKFAGSNGKTERSAKNG
jgi:hypothetical protein